MKKDTIYFVPLSGSEEVGSNLNLYCYNSKWIMIDAGIRFTNDLQSTVIVPSISGLRERYKDAIKNLCGIVITHCHEDHIGAVVHIWEEIYEENPNIKLYTTKVAAALLKHKISDVERYGRKIDIPIVIKDINEDYSVGPFKIKSAQMTHSTVEQSGMSIEFENGCSIFHTGDWKIDDYPLLGETTNISKIMGLRNVVAIVGDSTNALEEKKTGSELDVYNNLLELCSTKLSKKRIIIVTCFASNGARVDSISKIGKKCGREVILAGRSMHRFYEIFSDSGYIKNDNDIILLDRYDDEGRRSNHIIGKHRKLLIICTGSQGEENSFLAKLAENRVDKKYNISLSEDVAVVFSSREIPGNEVRIYSLVDEILRTGASVIRERKYHVSGHPARPDLEYLYKGIEESNPGVSIIPVHGSTMHIVGHYNYVQDHLKMKSHITRNGDVIEITENGLQLIDKVESRKRYLYGNELIDEDSPIIRDRNKLSGGVVFISITNDLIKVIQHGLFEYSSEKLRAFISDVEKDIIFILNNKHTYEDMKSIKYVIRRSIVNILKSMFVPADPAILIDLRCKLQY